MSTTFRFEVNTGASMHAIREIELSDDVLDLLTGGVSLGLESGMGAMAVAQRVSYLISELASRHAAMLDLTGDEEVSQLEAQGQATALNNAMELLDALVTHFNTMVVITKQ